MAIKCYPSIPHQLGPSASIHLGAFQHWVSKTLSVHSVNSQTTLSQSICSPGTVPTTSINQFIIGPPICLINYTRSIFKSYKTAIPLLMVCIAPVRVVSPLDDKITLTNRSLYNKHRGKTICIYGITIHLLRPLYCTTRIIIFPFNCPFMGICYVLVCMFFALLLDDSWGGNGRVRSPHCERQRRAQQSL